jgi:hypothetical protein
MVSVYSTWDPSKQNDMDILLYLQRSDPVKVAAGKAMSDADFAKLKPADIRAAEELAYHTLNLMFEEGSTAKQLIHTGANDDSIPIGAGYTLLQELHALFANDKNSTLDVDNLTESLTSFRMKTKEDAATYISRFRFIVDTLNAKKEPQTFHLSS